MLYVSGLGFSFALLKTTGLSNCFYPKPNDVPVDFSVDGKTYN